ncbi:MAG: 50S ribosomal protein L44e [Candidatus Nanoarchaeia archaeon]|nr:50S ribosomal protein L44e [Candidatus Nanoarchaeia archaeon]MDD5588022.1 50S ribosomal protein L44e [Candidatus Nanoarchaeia archaeon]
MKFPKAIKRYCPKCNKTTNQKVSQVKSGKKRSSLKKGSLQRGHKRGRGRGYGNMGRWGSKPTKAKRMGAKQGKNVNLKYQCTVCNKSSVATIGRAKKFELKQG